MNSATLGLRDREGDGEEEGEGERVGESVEERYMDK